MQSVCILTRARWCGRLKGYDPGLSEELSANSALENILTCKISEVNELFTVNDYLEQNAAIVSVTGELDLMTAPQFRESLLEAQASEKALVIVDLTNVTFIDSTAIGVLVGAFKRLRDGGIGMIIATQSPRVLRVFEVTDLDQLIKIVPSVEDALKQ